MKKLTLWVVLAILGLGIVAHAAPLDKKRKVKITVTTQKEFTIEEVEDAIAKQQGLIDAISKRLTEEQKNLADLQTLLVTVQQEAGKP